MLNFENMTVVWTPETYELCREIAEEYRADYVIPVNIICDNSFECFYPHPCSSLYLVVEIGTPGEIHNKNIYIGGMSNINCTVYYNDNKNKGVNVRKVVLDVYNTVRNINEVDNDKIYICRFDKFEIAKASKLQDGLYGWVNISSTESFISTHAKKNSLQNLLRSQIESNREVLEFDNIQELAKWVLKENKSF